MGVGRIRWVTKKIARAGMVIASQVGSRSSSNGEAGTVRPITYHGFKACARDPFSVSADDFRYQLDYLVENDLVVSLDDVDHCLKGKLGEARKPGVLVTIDDGLRSLYDIAFPILQSAGVHAVAFVTVGELGLNGEKIQKNGGAIEERISPAQLRELSDQGIEIGSHSFTHRSLAALPEVEAREEVRRSKEDLEDFLGKAVRAYAYPFGTKADFSPRTGAIVREVGYCFAFTSQHGPWLPSTDRYCLPRTKVEGGDPKWVYHGLLTGRMDGWRLVDETLWRVQSGGRI